MVASHLPLLFDADAGRMGMLMGHMARANPQWRDVRGEVMALFTGPHVYISPAWYEADGTVPTWNYVAVHAYGTFHVFEDGEILLELLRRTVAYYESPRPDPWTFDETAPHVDQMIRGIVGFRIEINRLEGKWKLSQNHPEERRRRVIRALEAQPDDHSQAVAAMMTERLTRSCQDKGGSHWLPCHAEPSPAPPKRAKPSLLVIQVVCDGS